MIKVIVELNDSGFDFVVSHSKPMGEDTKLVEISEKQLKRWNTASENWGKVQDEMYKLFYKED